MMFDIETMSEEELEKDFGELAHNDWSSTKKTDPISITEDFFIPLELTKKTVGNNKSPATYSTSFTDYFAD